MNRCGINITVFYAEDGNILQNITCFILYFAAEIKLLGIRMDKQAVRTIVYDKRPSTGYYWADKIQKNGESFLILYQLVNLFQIPAQVHHNQGHNPPQIYWEYQTPYNPVSSGYSVASDLCSKVAIFNDLGCW